MQLIKSSACMLGILVANNLLQRHATYSRTAWGEKIVNFYEFFLFTTKISDTFFLYPHSRTMDKIYKRSTQIHKVLKEWIKQMLFCMQIFDFQSATNVKRLLYNHHARSLLGKLNRNSLLGNWKEEEKKNFSKRCQAHEFYLECHIDGEHKLKLILKKLLFRTFHSKIPNRYDAHKFDRIFRVLLLGRTKFCVLKKIQLFKLTVFGWKFQSDFLLVDF